MDYIFKSYNSIDDFYNSPFADVKSFHWEQDKPYRPVVKCKLGVVQNDLVAILKVYETNPKSSYTKTNDPVYKDSCLEFFSQPVENRKEYINVECNSNGVYLSEFGASKEDRRYVNTLTALEPVVKPFSSADDNGDYWGVEIHLTKEFLSTLYGVSVNKINFNTVRANFYKCGDDCEVPHYAAFAPVSTLPPGFHNPSCFAIFNKECN